ncbi:MAG: crossover junction endodeoxyribonuclease RuvC [Dehalococcoidia bacterium]|nr:MAG: crossover junction endodeoxyribonuclease RuvC [Dehalococcoidia bacterium]
MRVLGIDPGTLNLGYGIVDEGEEGITMVDCGVLSVSSKIPVEQRLSSLYQKLGKIVNRYRPDEVAIEEPFVAGNARSALAIGRAQTVAILAAANRKLPVFRYLPTQVKQQVTNYGHSGKEQVQEMVRIQLGLSQSPQSTDATDALAVAICHLRQRYFDHLIANSQ